MTLHCLSGIRYIERNMQNKDKNKCYTSDNTTKKEEFMNQTIVKAIKERRLLELTYKNIRRTVEPHAYGVTKTGYEKFTCYQVKGPHSSLKPHDWDYLDASKITNLVLLEDSFSGTRPGHKRDDPAMTTIYAQL